MLERQCTIFGGDNGGSQEFRPVVSDVPDFRIGFEHLHFVGVERSQQIDRQAFGLFPVQPSVVVARVEDKRASSDAPGS